MIVLAYIVGSGALISIVSAILFLRVSRTENQGWSLSCALSEIVGFDSSGAPRYTSSISRFIALFGLILIFWIYAGVGLSIILLGRAPEGLKDIEGFLFFGLALFAPYLANQARAALVGRGVGVPTNLPAKVGGTVTSN